MEMKLPPILQLITLKCPSNFVLDALYPRGHEAAHSTHGKRASPQRGRGGAVAAALGPQRGGEVVFVVNHQQRRVRLRHVKYLHHFNLARCYEKILCLLHED